MATMSLLPSLPASLPLLSLLLLFAKRRTNKQTQAHFLVGLGFPTQDNLTLAVRVVLETPLERYAKHDGDLERSF
jgi:hypothetical protein